MGGANVVAERVVAVGVAEAATKDDRLVAVPHDLRHGKAAIRGHHKRTKVRAKQAHTTTQPHNHTTTQPRYLGALAARVVLPGIGQHVEGVVDRVVGQRVGAPDRRGAAVHASRVVGDAKEVGRVPAIVEVLLV